MPRPEAGPGCCLVAMLWSPYLPAAPPRKPLQECPGPLGARSQGPLTQQLLQQSKQTPKEAGSTVPSSPPPHPASLSLGCRLQKNLYHTNLQISLQPSLLLPNPAILHLNSDTPSDPGTLS